MKKEFKKVISFAVSFVLVSSMFCFTGKADSVSQGSGIVESANSFISSEYSTDSCCPWNSGTEISKTIYTYDLDGNINGAIFDLSTGNDESGYIVVSTLSGQPDIMEFGYEGEYNEKISGIDDKNLICLGLDDYLYKNDDGKYVNAYTDKELDVSAADLQGSYSELSSKLAASASSASGTSTLSLSAMSSGATGSVSLKSYIKSSHSITGISGFTPSLTTDLDSIFSENCVPTACVNMLRYWHDIRGKSTLYKSSVSKTYSKVCDYVGFKFGSGVSIAKFYGIFLGMKKYASAVCACSGCSYESSANLSWIEKYVNKNYMLFLVINAEDYSGDSENSGLHAVCCVGYRVLVNSDTGLSVPYLQIIDGWNTSVTNFYNFNYGDKLAFYLKW